jgi:hypothetical protein
MKERDDIEEREQITVFFFFVSQKPEMLSTLKRFVMDEMVNSFRSELKVELRVRMKVGDTWDSMIEER